MTTNSRISAVLALCVWLFVPRAPAQTFTTLYGFTGHIHGDGADPGGNLAIDRHGVLYGATASGGAVSPGIHCSELGCGTVFSLAPPSAPGAPWTEAVLWSFGGPGDGSDPAGGVVLGAGATGRLTLYGTTYYGGLGSGFGNGTVFSLTAPASPGAAWTESLIWTFGSSSGDGLNPAGGLLPGPNGIFYGTTANGGSAGGGTAFSLTPPSSPGGHWTETILWNFGAPGDGSYPVSILLRGGVLYGITQGGGTSTTGIVFSLVPPASSGPWTETVLYNFTASETFPTGLAIAGSGVLYGTTYGNQSKNGGTIFSLAPPASPGGTWTHSLLFSFPLKNNKGRDGDYPYGPLLIAKNGTLYGTAEFGGSANSGTIFMLKPPASPGGLWTYSLLHSFNGTSGGGLPFSGLVKGSGNLMYGTTGDGGPGSAGTVFSFIP